jgi:anti-sigma factor (TIGR02949 family)
VACDDNARLLHGYLDGELDLVRSLEIEEHLKTCPDCAQDLRSQQTLRKAFRSANLYDRAPRGLEARIRARLPRESRVWLTPRREFWNWVAVAAAIAVAFLLGWRGLPGWSGRSQPPLLAQEVVASHIRSLQPGHLVDVESTDQHTVKPWFNGKLDFSPPVKDFAADGFPLIGGRLDYLEHRNVAVLVYQRRKHLINLYLWPDESGADTSPRSVSSEGYHMIFWQSGGMYFCAISDVNADELGQFVQLFRK